MEFEPMNTGFAVRNIYALSITYWNFPYSKVLKNTVGNFAQLPQFAQLLQSQARILLPSIG